MKSQLMDVPFFQIWLNEKKILSDSSVGAYMSCVEAFLKHNPDLETLDDYNQFLIKVIIKKRASLYYTALRHFIDFKIKDNVLKNKLMEGLIKPPVRNDFKVERIYLTEDRIIAVINFLKKEKHKIIAIVQTLTGVRAGDIMRIRRGNIMLEEYEDKPALRLILVGKGNKRNVIYIHDKTAQNLIMEYITTHYTDNEYYFLECGKMKGREGKASNTYAFYRMNYWWYWEDLKQALNTLGIAREDFATHDFRRCFARRVWEKYKDIHKLQSLLNHNDPKVTLRYLEQSGMKNIHLHKEMQS